jgi:hypothetical protein
MSAHTALTRGDLWSLEEYSQERAGFRDTVLAHKKNRQVLLGEHILLIFEDRMTLKYQIQEMLRIEKVFESAGIQEELDAYNPLLPDGNNWKCTMLIQFTDVDERRVELQRLIGIEEKVWVQIGDCEKVFAIADEDMERANEEKTSAVHFLRYQLTEQQISEAKSGAELFVGVDHEAYSTDVVKVGDEVKQALYIDLA